MIDVLEIVDEGLSIMGVPWENVSLIVQGGARGVDRLAKQMAIAIGIPHREIRPRYDLHGRFLAPLIRNGEMADVGDICVAIRRNMSSGTTDMVRKMQERNKPFYLKEIS